MLPRYVRGFAKVTEPVLIAQEALLSLHMKGLSRFGGAGGLRDQGLLESALTRPLNAFQYRPETDMPSLAAAYAYDLAKNHPFVDGNKRAAFLAAGLFLELNGWRLTASPPDAISAMLMLASGEIGKNEFAAWLRANCTKL